MRLSFRLDADGAEVWGKLRTKHEGRRDSYIFKELLRQEDFRLQGNTKDDKLKDIVKRLEALEAKMNRLLDMMEPGK